MSSSVRSLAAIQDKRNLQAESSEVTCDGRGRRPVRTRMGTEYASVVISRPGSIEDSHVQEIAGQNSAKEVCTDGLSVVFIQERLRMLDKSFDAGCLQFWLEVHRGQFEDLWRASEDAVGRHR